MRIGIVLCPVGSLAPLGGSSSSSSSSAFSGGGGGGRPTSGGGGLGSLGSLASLGRPSAASASPPADDLDSGLDALLSASPPAASASKKQPVATRKTSGDRDRDRDRDNYSDSGSDDDRAHNKKKKKSSSRDKDKEKKKKSSDRDRSSDRGDRERERERERERDRDRDRAAAATAADSKRKPAAAGSASVPLRPATAPMDAFDDDALFGIKQQQQRPSGGLPASDQFSLGGATRDRRTSASKSQSQMSRRGVSTAGNDGDWDQDDSEAGDEPHIDTDDVQTSAPNTQRGRAASAAASLAPPAAVTPSSRSTSATHAAEEYFASKAREEEPPPPPPATFGSRRPRAASAAEPSSASSTSSFAPAPTPSPPLLAAPAPSPVPTHNLPARSTGAVVSPPPSEFFLPGSEEGDAAPAETAAERARKVKEALAAKRAAAKKAQEDAEAAAARTVAASAMPAAVANRRGPFDAEDDPAPDQPQQPHPQSTPSPVTAASDSPQHSPHDPFASVLDEANPMDEIDDRGGNLFSGFGDAKPAAASAAPTRTRRALLSGAGAGAGGVNKPPSATASATGGARLNTAPASIAAVSAASSRPSATSASSAAPATAPPAPTLENWIEWLGINSLVRKDDGLIRIAKQALATPLPKHWRALSAAGGHAPGGGAYFNARTGREHSRHPFLKHFLAKVQSKRLAIQYNVADDESDNDSVVESGDERESSNNQLNSPSSINRSALDDSFNPLSPPAKASGGFHASAKQPAAATTSRANPHSASSSALPTPTNGLSINTAASTPASQSGSTISTHPHPYHHASNMTPSPYTGPAGASAFHHGPVASPSNQPGALPSMDSLPSRSPSYQRLESVPERGSAGNSLSSMDELMARSGSTKTARMVAEQERQSHERIQAATLAAHSMNVPQQHTGGAVDSARVGELMAQLHVQSVTIEELEKRKRQLLFQLESTELQLTSTLNEQRARFESAALETERRSHTELESLRSQLSRAEQRHASQLREMEDRLSSSDARRSLEINDAVKAAEQKIREVMDHSLRMAASQLEGQKVHYERELDALKSLHSNELESLKAQASSSVFLRTLVTQVESSASTVENLSKRVLQERSASERLTFEQLQIRDKLLSEKEASLDAERRQNEQLLATFQKLQREHEEDKVRLREEHLRLAALQSDIQSEGALMKEQLQHEREQLRKERTLVQSQRESWEVKHRREMADLEMKKELNERAHVQTLEGLEEAQRERADVLKQLDDEREEIRVEKRNLAQRRAALDANEAALRSDEAEFQKHVAYFESRMNELTALGAKVKAQSESVAEQYGRLASERALVEQAKLEARSYIDEQSKLKEAGEAELARLREQKVLHEKDRSSLLADQKKFMLDRDLALRALQVSKAIQGFHPSHAPMGSGIGSVAYPPHILSPPLPSPSHAAGLGAAFTHEEPSLMSHSFHTAPATAALLAPQTTPHALARSDRHASLHNHAYDSGHISAALASLSSHADHLRGFMQDEKILSPRSSV